MTEMQVSPAPETLAQRAARAVLSDTVQGATIEKGEDPLAALGWYMGVRINYEQGMADLVAEAIKLHDAEREALSFKAGDDVVSWYEDEAGVWTMLELTEEDAEGMEWRTVATLLLSDVEAADLARRLTDRSIEA